MRKLVARPDCKGRSTLYCLGQVQVSSMAISLAGRVTHCVPSCPVRQGCTSVVLIPATSPPYPLLPRGGQQVYDVLNFDMIVMLRLPYTPGCADWIFKVRRAYCFRLALPGP